MVALSGPLNLTGATAATRWAGGTTSGAPVTGTFAVGDFVIDETGVLWICTAAGSPGTWSQVGGTTGVQNHDGIFGNGSDGAITLDGVATFAGTFGAPAGNVYTQLRDVQCTNLVVNNGVTVKTAGFRISCTGTLSGPGTISNAGNNAVSNTAGAQQANGSFAGGRAGGAGGTGVSGAGGNGANALLGVAGGNGGAGTSGAAGTGGTVTISGANAVNNNLQTPFSLLMGMGSFSNATYAIGWGAGGGGGGSDASSNVGGGGGGGGGVIAIFAQAINFTGTITVAGGNGAAGAAGNSGGGGGGAGGLLATYSLTAAVITTTVITGGALGAGHGTGSAGVAGGTGSLVNVVLT